MANVTLKRWNGSAWVEMLTTPAAHTHTIANITNLQTTLDGKLNLSGGTLSGTLTANAGINLNNNNITGINNLTIGDPGPNEGIEWAGGNLWKIYETPNDLTTNGAGNLQIVQNATRRATFNTSGQLELPVTNGTAPLVISSTTAVSNLNADLLDGNHASDMMEYQSLSEFASGTLVRTSINASVSTGDSFVIEIVGKSYSTSAPPFKYIAQGYLYNGSIINYSGLDIGANLGTVKIFEDSGNLCFWWARVSYWNSFKVRVYRASSADSTPENTVTAITDSTEPTGTKKVTLNAYQVFSTYHLPTTSEVSGLQTALDLKANLASPTFTGTPAAPTASAGTNTTQLATTAFVRTEVANLIASAPGTLDTLDELASALGDDPNFATTVTNSIAGKASLTGATFTGDVYAPRFIANPSSGGNDTSGAWGIADYDDKLSAVRDYITDTYYPIYHTGNKPAVADVTGLQTALDGKLGTGAKAADSELLDGLDSSAYLRDDGWNTSPGQDANTQPNMKADFTYANNAPWTGSLVSFGAGSYQMQFNAAYGGDGEGISYRTRNGDTATWNNWNRIFHDDYHPNADTLTTARTLTIGSTGKTFNGSANVSWSLGEIGAAATSHTHAISDVTNLQTTLDGKASTSHTHLVADITDLTATATELNYVDGVTSSIQTQLNGKAATSHTHSAADITSGTLALARGGTGTTTTTAGGFVIGATGAGSLTTTSAPSGTTQYAGSTFNGTNYLPNWVSPNDSSTRTVLSSSSTVLATERDVFWGTRYIHLGVTTTAGQNVSRTISFTSGMKNFILQLHQDTTTGAVIARLPLTISNSAGTSTDTDVYSLDTTTRTHRVAWSNGSAVQIMNVSISYSGTTITVSHNFNFNAAFRLFGF